MKAWFTALVLLALSLLGGASDAFHGAARLAGFSKENNARILLYFNNENDLALVTDGRMLPLAMDTHLWAPESCCAHRATPALSRDGARVAFVHLGSKQPHREAIAVYDTAARGQKDVFTAQAVWGIAWSPDGNRLAVVADNEAESGHNLYLIDFNSASVSQLTHGRLHVGGANYTVSDYAPPSWSATGRELALELRNSAGAMIAVLELESNRLRKLADGVEPSWSPSGDRVAYFDGGRQYCYSVQPDGSDKTLLFSATRGFLGAGGGAPLFFPVVWSPDGRRVLWHEWNDADLLTEIYLRDLKTGKVKHVGRSELQVVNWR
jgi:Tol biopolymer transport system component